MIKIKFLILALLILGCSKNKDPLENVRFGITHMDSFSNNIPTNLIKSKPKSTIPELFKENIFEYKFPYKDSLLKYKLVLNPDKYDFGRVRHLKILIPEQENIFFDEDTITTKLKTDVLLKNFIEWYGIPDTLTLKNSNLTTRQEKMDFLVSSNKLLIWDDIENYSIKMSLPSLRKFAKTEVTYEMKGLKKELESINDSIVNNQTVDSLIQPIRVNCYWKDINTYIKEFGIQVSSIVRKDTYDEREITSIRFDLIVQDEFEKTFYQASDLTSKIEPPLYRKNFEYSTGGNPILLTTKYDIRNSSTNDLENARKYRKNNKLKYKAENVQLVLSDGTVIK